MHVDAIAFIVSCVREVDVAQGMTEHGHTRLIPELSFAGEFEAEFAPETTCAGVCAGGAHAAQGDRLVKKLELSVLASLTGVNDRQFVRTGSGPPQRGQGHRYGQNQQVVQRISGHGFITLITVLTYTPYTRGRLKGM